MGEGLVSTFVAGTSEEHERFASPAFALWSGTSFATPRVAAQLARQLAGDAFDCSVADAVQMLQAQGTKLPGHGAALRAP